MSARRKHKHKGGPRSRRAVGGRDRAIQPGMTVRATEGDLGTDDISQAKVAKVQRDAAGNPTSMVVEKGIVFRKRIAVPQDRIARVEPAPAREDAPGTVTIDAGEPEVEALGPLGEEALSPAGAETGGARPSRNPLAWLEEALPTAEGLRRRSGRARARQRAERHARVPNEQGAAHQAHEGASEGHAREAQAPAAGFSLRQLGPGFLSGMAGNDASAVTSYAVNGATNGYGQLWLMLVATPLLQSVQYTAGKIGRVTQDGLGVVLREHYGRRVAAPAAALLIVANLALITADLVAVGTGIQLITGIAWEWFVVPVALGLWYLTVFQSFGVIKKIFVGMSLAFVAYLITGIFAGAHWGEVLKATFVPHIGFDSGSIASAVAILGATVSPYTIYWQMHAEREEPRGGTTHQQIRSAAFDIGAGTISGNLIAFFIIVCTGATLFTHHQHITTAADAARALAPLVGPFAKYLFAIGLMGAGLIAIPVLLASTSYAVAEVFGWPASLWSKPWQNEGFYLILSAALLVCLGLALLRLDPIQLMFGANVLQGVLAPFLVLILMVVGNSRKIMRTYRLGALTNIGLALTALLMFAASALLFYGMLTGHGN